MWQETDQRNQAQLGKLVIYVMLSIPTQACLTWVGINLQDFTPSGNFDKDTEDTGC